MNGNNEFYQNSMMNLRRDEDEWKTSVDTCSPNLIEKSITDNGNYSAKADGADGYSSVTVEVPSAPVPETFEVNIEITQGGDFSVIIDKTYAEIASAYDNGNKIIGQIRWIVPSEIDASLDIIVQSKNTLNGTEGIYLATMYVPVSIDAATILLTASVFIEDGNNIVVSLGTGATTTYTVSQND